MKTPPLTDVDSGKLEPILETMILAAQADGEFSDEERSHLVQSLESLTNRQLSSDALHKLVDRVAASVDANGRTAHLELLRGQLDPAARRVAVELAVALMAVDGVIRTAERELVLEIAEAFELDADHVADVVRRHHP